MPEAQGKPDKPRDKNSSKLALGFGWFQLLFFGAIALAYMEALAVDWSPAEGNAFFAKHHDLLMGVALSYAPVLWVAQKYMETRGPFDLKWVLFIHNLSMSVMSIWGTMCIWAHIISTIRNKGWILSMTEDPYVNEDRYGASFAAFVFALSKFWEYFDTLFLVLRKKPVSFLHSYHHPATLLYTWWSYQLSTSTGAYFSGINYFVHSVMYFYFALTALGYKWKWAWIITQIQISQMAFGMIVITVFGLYSTRADPDGQLKLNNNVAFGMYLSYFFLFLSFYARRFFSFNEPSSPQKNKRE